MATAPLRCGAGYAVLAGETITVFITLQARGAGVAGQGPALPERGRQRLAWPGDRSGPASACG
ncbi:hypothetical protein DD607_29335, partial [Salmonella sp. 3DZ2-4SM]